jgi:hypothetical protein
VFQDPHTKPISQRPPRRSLTRAGPLQGSGCLLRLRLVSTSVGPPRRKCAGVRAAVAALETCLLDGGGGGVLDWKPRLVRAPRPGRCEPLRAVRISRQVSWRQGLRDRWSNTGQMLVKYWSNAGQILKHGLPYSGLVEQTPRRGCARCGAWGRPLVKYWSNAGQILVK